ncbi:MAG: hypothetical protein U1D35_08205, partial [Paracoccaceae bacterium]|nr:hypothetical protein [Paracoccaceae bacterium]
MRFLLTAVLVLALMVGSLQNAMARATAPASVGLTQMVICAEAGAVLITLDATGNRVDPAGAPPSGGQHARHCPDCLLTPAMDLVRLATAPQPRQGFARAARFTPESLPAPIRRSLR